MSGRGDTTNGVGWAVGLRRAYRAGRSLALFFDYDGTLTPIVSHPTLARLSTRTATNLSTLAALPDVAVGVISGRSLADVKAFVGLDGVYFAGSSGLELDLCGRRVDYPGTDDFRRVLAPLERDLRPVLDRHTGAWVERKPVAVTIHYRALAPAAVARLRAETTAVFARHPRVSYRHVSDAIEITPAEGWDKGTAVETILQILAPDVLPVYFGDAANDAEAMAVVALVGGVAVGVGPDAPTTANHRVTSAEEVDGWLGWLARELSQTRVERSNSDEPVPDPTPILSVDPAEGDGTDGPGVLILDPDPGSRAASVAAFRRQGWRVWPTADANAAVDTVRRHAGALRAAVVDLQLVGLESGRVLTAIKRDAPHVTRYGFSADVPAYAITAYVRQTDIPLLGKPVDPEAVTRVGRAMSVSTIREEEKWARCPQV